MSHVPVEWSHAKPIYIAAYHQSEFGKLMGMTVPEIIKASVDGVCQEIKADPSVIDVGSVAPPAPTR